MSIPRKDPALADWSTNANAKLVASGATTYQLTASQVSGYTLKHDEFLAAYNAMKAARDEGNRAENLTADKDDKKKALLDYARPIYAFVQANLSITDGDKILLGVTPRDSEPTPIPPPANAPELTVVGVNGRIVEVRLRDPADPDRRALPVGVDGAIVMSHVGETAPSDPFQFAVQGALGKTSGTVVIPDSAAPGTKVWLSAVWFNEKKQFGPASFPISTHVGFDGVIPMAA